jgi:hypothetical protein
MNAMAPFAAIGLRLHSGWAVGVLIAQDTAPEPRLIARRRIMLCELPHAKQPYHAAENMELEEAEAFIARCRAATLGLAVRELERLRQECGACKLAGVGLAASSARNLPALSSILHSHALIHAAEGVFYREAAAMAAAQIRIKTCAIKSNTASEFLATTPDLRDALERIGKAAGPPWTMDEKGASLAALSLLPDLARKFHLEKLHEPIG